MGIRSNGVGIITFVCDRCGAKLYWYAIGDRGNKDKFNGPPSPSRLKGFDDHKCPMCASKLGMRPKRVLFLSRREFEEKFFVGKFKIMARQPSMVETHIEQRVGVTEGIADVGT